MRGCKQGYVTSVSGWFLNGYNEILVLCQTKVWFVKVNLVFEELSAFFYVFFFLFFVCLLVFLFFVEFKFSFFFFRLCFAFASKKKCLLILSSKNLGTSIFSSFYSCLITHLEFVPSTHPLFTFSLLFFLQPGSFTCKDLLQSIALIARDYLKFEKHVGRCLLIQVSSVPEPVNGFLP